MISPEEIHLRRSWILSGPFSIRRQENHFKTHGLRRSVRVAVGNSGLALLGGDPGSAILLNGVMQTANLEIGVPGFQPQVPTSTSEFRLSPSPPMGPLRSKCNVHDAVQDEGLSGRMWKGLRESKFRHFSCVDGQQPQAMPRPPVRSLRSLGSQQATSHA